MCIFPIDIDLGKEWECHTEVHLADLLDCLVGFWLLTEKLITGKSEYHEVLMRVGIPEFLELLELWRESALGRSIDNEEDFSLVLTHGDCFSF